MTKRKYDAAWWSRVEIDWDFKGRFPRLARLLWSLGLFEVAFSAKYNCSLTHNFKGECPECGVTF